MCDAKKCINENGTDYITMGELKIHRECMTKNDWLKKTADLYVNFYNDTESWAVMMKSLTNWNKKHDAEYICYTMSKAIRNKERLVSFYSLYYVLNNLNYKESYKNYKNPTEHIVFDNVFFTKSEYTELLMYLNNNNSSAEYYIKKLNDYIISTGKEYSNHLTTLKQWIDKDNDRKIVKYETEIL